MAAARLDALLVPRADEHQGEYVPASAARLHWLTGFSGSAGLAVIARKAAALFVDGRYTVQARAEVDAGVVEIAKLPRGRLAEWIAENLGRGQTVGFDPRLHAVSRDRAPRSGAQGQGHQAEAGHAQPRRSRLGPRAPAAAANPVDRAPLEARRPLGAGQDRRHPEAAEGRRARRRRADALPTRSPGVQHPRHRHSRTPRSRSRSRSCRQTASRSSSSRPRSCDAAARCHLEAFAKLSSAGALTDRLKALRKTREARAARSAHARPARSRARSAGRAASRAAPIPALLLKAVKNAAEIEGARAAHVRDGAAVTRFLAWLDREAAAGALDEIDGRAPARSLPRAPPDQLQEISFDTISGCRAERRDRALPRQRGDEPQAASRASCSSRQRRAVSRRHHRHHAHRRHRQADRRDARALHAGAQGPHRHRQRRAFRKARAASTSIRSRAAPCGSTGSTTTTAPATASAAICPCTRGRSRSRAPAWPCSSPA